MHEIMQFILPVVAASGEAMLWILMILILVVIGRGKMLPSEKHLIIERHGKYRMDLAPGLNLAQPFIEAIAQQIPVGNSTDNLTLRFEVRDKNISSRKQPFYLLSVSLQNGHLSFEACPSQEPHTVPHSDEILHPEIVNAIHAVANTWGIGLQRVS